MHCGAAGVTQAECDEYVSLRDEIGKYEKIIHTFICKPDVCIPFLKTGRIVKVREGSTDWDGVWCCRPCSDLLNTLCASPIPILLLVVSKSVSFVSICSGAADGTMFGCARMTRCMCPGLP